LGISDLPLSFQPKGDDSISGSFLGVAIDRPKTEWHKSPPARQPDPGGIIFGTPGRFRRIPHVIVDRAGFTALT